MSCESILVTYNTSCGCAQQKATSITVIARKLFIKEHLETNYLTVKILMYICKVKIN